MRLAIIADVHGNLPALEAVMADIGRRGADRVVNLGDCVSGPLWPRETCDLLMAAGMPTVRGNHDRWVATLEPDRMGPSDRHGFVALDEAHRRWLGALPTVLTLEGGIALFHATPADDTRYLLDEVAGGRLALAAPEAIAERLGAFEGRIALCGHSHQPRVVRLWTGVLVVNPGSVGCPGYVDDGPDPHVSETGAPHARYAMLQLDGNRASVELIAVEYDWDGAADLAARNGRPEWASALRTGYVR